MLQLSLKVIGGRHDGKQIPIKGKKFLIGREEDCHLRPNSDMVSRHHCVFTVDEYSVRLRDFGSTNGTLVNGKRIKGEVQLSHGDKIQVGKLDFEIVISHSPEANVIGVGWVPDPPTRVSSLFRGFNEITIGEFRWVGDPPSNANGRELSN